MNAVLSEFQTDIALFAERLGDGSIEVSGLGFPVTGTDNACLDCVAALADVDPLLDPDDLRDEIAQLVLEYLDES